MLELGASSFEAASPGLLRERHRVALDVDPLSPVPNSPRRQHAPGFEVHQVYSAQVANAAKYVPTTTGFQGGGHRRQSSADWQASFYRSSSGDAQTFRTVQTLKGLYLVKVAVFVMAAYLGVQELIDFSDVLLPFIFAVLLLIVLEPLKRFIASVLHRLTIIFFEKARLQCLLDTRQEVSDYSQVRSSRGSRFQEEISPASYEDGYASISAAEASSLSATDSSTKVSDLTGSTGNARSIAVPKPSVRRLILVVSIIVCIMTSARVFWITAKVFLRAGYAISKDVAYYKEGSARLKGWIEQDISNMHMKALDWGKFLDGVVEYVEDIGKLVTANVLTTAAQAVVTLIFLLYMLWSPVKMDSGTVVEEVFSHTAKYIKVKTLISASTGCLISIVLLACGLDLAAAFGLLAFLAKFLPGIGSMVATVMPCTLAIIDIRKTPTQVLVAFVLQVVIHLVIDFFIEPVFFGISAEIHSVIVILGIWFFYQVWGMAGMLLSVPLLAVCRLLLKSMKQAHQAGSTGDDVDAVVFFDSILQGRWMSNVGPGAEFGDLDDAEMEMQNVQYEVAVAEEANWQRAFGGRPRCVEYIEEAYHGHRLTFEVTMLLVGGALLIFIPLLI